MRTLLVATTALTVSLSAPAFAGTQGAAPFSYTQTGEEITASSFIGARVYTSQTDVQDDESWLNWDGSRENWNDVGEIHDVLMTREGQIEAILVDVGGFLGIGEKQVSVDMDELRLVADGHKSEDYFVVFTSTPEALQNAPAHNTGEINTAAVETGANETTQTYTAPRIERDGFAKATVEEMSAEILTGARVYDAEDNWIGEVNKLNLADGGLIDEAVIDVGGFLGIGEKQVALKFDNLDVLQQTDGDGVRVYLDATKDALMEMPEYEG